MFIFSSYRTLVNKLIGMLCGYAFTHHIFVSGFFEMLIVTSLDVTVCETFAVFLTGSLIMLELCLNEIILIR